MSRDRNRWGGNAADVVGELAPTSGHIGSLVLARWAAWTGGRPEDCGHTLHASLLPTSFSGCGSGVDSCDPDPQRTVHRGRCEWRLSTLSDIHRFELVTAKL